jgi:hypothetical protein
VKYPFYPSSGSSAPWSTASHVLLLTLVLAASGCETSKVESAKAQPSTTPAADSATPAPVVEEAVPVDSVSVAPEISEDAPVAANAEAAPETSAPKKRYAAGTDPDFAAAMGWPVKAPEPLPGAILPDKRIVCYYGNPNSKRMGALGEYPKDEMLQRLRREVDNWNKADPTTPVQPCLHMVSVVAQGEPGTSGKYRSIMLDKDVQKVYDWAKEVNGIFIVDIQVGTDDIRNILPRFEWILKNPDVHLGVDPEFYMKGGQRPGTKIGTMDAADINYVTDYLAKLVREHNLPPKTLVVHRFTRPMVTNYKQIKLRPEVQIVMHMDGWGAPWLKRDSYRDYVVKEPVHFTGFKLFYHNDTKAGDPLMMPKDLLELRPLPLYIQYQ